MKEAIEHVDLKQIEVLIEQVREQDHILADTLQKQIDQFEYERVLAAIQNTHS